MAFYYHLLLLILIKTVMDGHCLQTKIYLLSTVPHTHTVAYGEVKVP